MKVGPPKHTRPTNESKCLGSGVRVTAHRMMSRLAGLEAKKRLKRLHESSLEGLVCQADETGVPANLADRYHKKLRTLLV